MSDIKITKHRNWNGAGKGDYWRPGADFGKYQSGWDNIKKRNHSAANPLPNEKEKASDQPELPKQ